MEIKDLKANPKNPRKVTNKKLMALKNSMKEFGDLGGVVFNKRSNQLIGGHQRISLLKDGEITLGESGEYGFIVKDGQSFALRVVDWDENKEKAANIAANKGAGEWDMEMLGDWFKDLSETDFDLNLTMFDEDERKQFFVEPTVYEEGLTDPDAIPDHVETRCKPGDLWLLGNHRLLCGDSTDVLQVERLMGGEKADMVFTDPPYGVSYQSNMRKKSERFNVIENDDKILTEWINILPIVSHGWVFIWTSWKVLNIWLEVTAGVGCLTNLVVWDKGGGGIGDLAGTFSSDYELALVFNRGSKLTGKRIGSVWDVGKDKAKDYVHPTQKPVDLAIMAFSSCIDDGAKVLDLFLGSGSTLIACEKTKRECYGMELDPKYCDVILERWEKFTGNQAVLSSSGQ